MSNTSLPVTSSAEQIINELGAEAVAASAALIAAPDAAIDGALEALSGLLRSRHDAILAANAKDLAGAKDRGLTDALIDRLTLTPERIEAMAAGVDTVRGLPAPVGSIMEEWERPNGLVIQKIRVPIGVLGMIYESRPNVTIDASALTLKSRNAVLLRGGSESLNSSLALHALVREALEANDLPPGCAGMVPVADRAAVTAMLRADQFIDVMIPRGGRGLVEKVLQEARMPAFAHLDGICHTYIHESADPDMARCITLNAKMRRTGICCATETLLVDEKLPKPVIADIVGALIEANCTVYGTPEIRAIDARVEPATEQDWSTEYLDARISVRTVSGTEEAAAHINRYGSGHTDSIITEDDNAAAYFIRHVDSGSVMHNASTQFADGGEYGMGAEIGIATGKLHARGPVGVEQLTTYKYVVRGRGQTRP